MDSGPKKIRGTEHISASAAEDQREQQQPSLIPVPPHEAGGVPSYQRQSVKFTGQGIQNVGNFNVGRDINIMRDGPNPSCLVDLRTTDPRHDKKRIQDTKGGLLKDSYRWILDNADFQRWRDDEQSRLLWIKGDPGKGKTMLLCGIIDELKSKTGLLSYFFCQAADSRINNATAVLRGLIYLLVDQQPSLISHVQKKYDHSGKGLFEDVNAWVALSEILTDVLQDPSLKSTVLIIDALDECVTNRTQLLDLIVQMSSESYSKWIVSSRNWPEIEKRLEIAGEKVNLCLELNAESVSAAVGKYIQHKVDRLARLQRYDSKTRDAVREHLSSNANDTFLWVALVCQELEKISRRNTRAKLKAFPPGLDDLYERMMEQIRSSDDVDICKPILACVMTVYRPITLKEITSLVDMQEDIPDDPEYLEEAIRLCGSFLTIRDCTIYFVHQSAKDFLLAKTAGDIFLLKIQEEHHNIFSRSLQVMSEVLQRDMYGLDAPGFPIDKVNQPDPDPLAAVRYSCVYWADHLSDSDSCGKHLEDFQDGGAVDTFLRKKYLYWLEALSLLKSMSQGVLSMAKLEGLLQQRPDASRLKDLVRDTRRFILYHKWAIGNSPLQVYASALVFTPARSITKNLFKKEEPEWITIKSAIEDDWNACLQTLKGHSDRVNAVAFSPDGTVVASASEYGTVKLWDARSGQEQQTLKGHSRSVNAVAFSPDGTVVASASDDRTVKLWDARSGQEQHTLKGHSGSVNAVAFSPGSTVVASVSRDGTVKLWDARSGQEQQTLEGHSRSVNAVAFSPDGTVVASASEDGTVKLWNARSGQEQQTLGGHLWLVDAVAFSPDGTVVASASYNGTIKLWDVRSGQEQQTLKGHSRSVNAVAFSPDGTVVASASDDRTVKLWDARSGQEQQTLKGHSGSVNAVTFSPGSTVVASVSRDGTVKLWDARSGQEQQTLEGHSSSVEAMAFSPDGTVVASASEDGTVKLWDARSGQEQQTLKGRSGLVSAIAFSLDGTVAASASHDGTVKLQDARSRQEQQTLKKHSRRVKAVAFSPDVTVVALVLYDGIVKLWDARSGQQQKTLKGHSDSLNAVAFSPDGTVVASASDDRTVKLWDVRSGQEQQTLKGHLRPVNAVAFSPDGTVVASASRDGIVKLWNARSGQEQQTLKGTSTFIKVIAFSPDGTIVASGLDGGTVKLWDARLGQEQQTLKGHSGLVSAIAFSLDGTAVASASYDRTVKLWDARSGQEQKTLKVDFTLHKILFLNNESYLNTDRGVLDITPTPSSSTSSVTIPLFVNEKWIVRGSEALLWIPPEYRATSVAVFGGLVVLGHASGRVSIIEFTLQAKV